MNIDISKLNKAEVLAALYNASKPLGMGWSQAAAEDMTAASAQGELNRKESKRFDYLKGRVMKVDLSGDWLRPALYDRDNGEGAAARALQPLLANQT